MAQFTIYQSGDLSAPVLTGAAGSLIALFKACLVDGYGAKAAPSPAWSQPVATASNIGSFKMNAGSGLGFVLNDAGPNGTATFKEAWATGWESVAGVGSPVGSGSGQFPTAAQLLTTGHVVIRKSTTADATARQWIMFADSTTLYFHALTGDAAGTYFSFMFGDIYSLKSTADLYRCAIIGRYAENSATGAGAEGLDNFSLVGSANNGNFMARTYGGGGASITIGKHGDYALTSGSGFLAGTAQTPNGPDNSYYIAPMWVTEPSASTIRGRLRGMYEMCHPIASFSDGQTISGSGDYAGKTFQVVKQSAASGMYLMEISNTLETN
jgi:hypothetical protein